MKPDCIDFQLNNEDLWIICVYAVVILCFSVAKLDL